MRRYRWKKADEWSADLGLLRVMEVAGNRVKQGAGPFTLTQDGDVVVKQLTRADALDKFRLALKNRAVGEVFRVKTKAGDIAIAARSMLDIADVDSTNGNKKADEFFNWVKATYSQYDPRFAGAYVCKKISGSSTMSEHSAGNAVDFFFNTLAQQDQVYNDIRQGRCPVPIAEAISMRTIWIYGSGVRAYGGDFHSHLHVSFRPKIYPTVCGVRN
jgi:hypothetical protein